MKKHPYNLLTIVLLCLLIFSCSPENDYTSIEKQESALLIRSKEWLNSKHTINEKDVLWNSATLYQQSAENSFVAIIPVKSSNSFLLQKIILDINDYNITGKLWSFDFKDSQEIEDLQKIATHKILESFTGELRITNLETMDTRKDNYKQGIANGNNLFSKSSGAGVCNNCHGDEGAIKLNEVVVTGPGGSPWPNPITNPVNPPIVPIGGGSSGGSANWNRVEQIKDNNLDPCGKSALEKLKNLKQNDITKMLQRFGGPISPYDVTMQKGPVLGGPSVFGQTIKLSDNNYQITINQDYLNGVIDSEPNSPPTDLSVATTLIHEIIHAYFLSIIDQQKSTGNSSLSDFPTLFEAYVRSTNPGSPSNDMADAHHAEIANRYVDIMASALQEFNTGTPVASGAAQQMYKDLAWGSLQGTPIYNAKLSTADKDRIAQRKTVEARNKSRGNQNPQGKPCN
ncbi:MULTISPECIES: hypothetical protein [Flavobacterium]|uniref:Cytochrome c domain-containing protein n=1 Tax=Flavobacterium lipolyticum TaxID=2893754 RepID=A0ABS8LYM5_9FLAO|nr:MULTISPECIES: hypothetical protein [unclassified Flavobacterium]MCC9017680.1 hypothetical protein [Flavobacterium sp. F-126]